MLGRALLRALLIVAVFLILSRCELFDRTPHTPIGHSRDENGRDCATYEIKSDRVYETLCNYGGAYPSSVKTPLSRQ